MPSKYRRAWDELAMEEAKLRTLPFVVIDAEYTLVSAWSDWELAVRAKCEAERRARELKLRTSYMAIERSKVADLMAVHSELGS